MVVTVNVDAEQIDFAAEFDKEFARRNVATQLIFATDCPTQAPVEGVIHFLRIAEELNDFFDAEQIDFAAEFDKEFACRNVATQLIFATDCPTQTPVEGVIHFLRIAEELNDFFRR